MCLVSTITKQKPTVEHGQGVTIFVDLLKVGLLLNALTHVQNAQPLWTKRRNVWSSTFTHFQISVTTTGMFLKHLRVLMIRKTNT